jgi:hypothetical protein
MQILIIFETRDSFWENLIQRFQGFSHVFIVMEGMRYETHPKHGVIVSRYTNTNDKNVIHKKITYTQATRIARQAAIHSRQGYSRISLLQGLIRQLTGVWIGGKPDKFNCASWVAFCLWPENPDWYKFNLVDIYEKVS